MVVWTGPPAPRAGSGGTSSCASTRASMRWPRASTREASRPSRAVINASWASHVRWPPVKFHCRRCRAPAAAGAVDVAPNVGREEARRREPRSSAARSAHVDAAAELRSCRCTGPRARGGAPAQQASSPRRAPRRGASPCTRGQASPPADHSVDVGVLQHAGRGVASGNQRVQGEAIVEQRKPQEQRGGQVA